ncbi:phosphatase domain-containing protein [Nonomuraea sp. NPDC003707]
MNRDHLVQAVGDKLNEHWPYLLNDGVQYRVAVDALGAAHEAGALPAADREHLRERLDDALAKREAYAAAMHELFGGIAAARDALSQRKKGKPVDWQLLEDRLVGKVAYADERLGTRPAREASELRQRAEDAEREAAELRAELAAFKARPAFHNGRHQANLLQTFTEMIVEFGSDPAKAAKAVMNYAQVGLHAAERETARAHQLAEVVHTSYGRLNAAHMELQARVAEAIDLIGEYDGPEAPFEHHPKWAHVRYTLTTPKPRAIAEQMAPGEDAGLPLAVVVDVDGTVAEKGDRDPFDWARVGEDTPVWHVIETVRALYHRGYRIVVMSGRSDECRAATAAWLNAHLGVPWEDLHMRAAGDYRKDAEVKTELYETRVRGQYDVRMVIDDRQQVVDAWRAQGLPVFQVAPGDL